MTAGFEVDVDRLHRHGGRVADVASSVRQAATAGGGGSLVGSEFGVLCASIGAAVGLFEDAVGHALRSTADSLEASADGVRAMVTDYRASDERAVDLLRGLTP